MGTGVVATGLVGNQLDRVAGTSSRSVKTSAEKRLRG